MRDYTAVTEAPDTRVTQEALAMLYARYGFACSFCADKDVLEIGCGAGQGLRYLATKSRRAVGGDVTEHLLHVASRHNDQAVAFVRLDAHAIPFCKGSFDVIILYEAIYYLQSADQFLDECCRVLRPGGWLLICSANKEWSGFNPSPSSTMYFSARELADILRAKGFNPRVYGAFPAAVRSPAQRAVALIRRAAVVGHLIPRTMRGKEMLKRLFYGPLVAIPLNVREPLAAPEPLVELADHQSAAGFKVIYGAAQRG